MRARSDWRENHICPLCGYPKEYCQTPQTEFELADPMRVRCHITTRLRAAQKAYAEDPTARPEGVLYVPQFQDKSTSAQ